MIMNISLVSILIYLNRKLINIWKIGFGIIMFPIHTQKFSKECEPQLVMPAIVNYMEENPGEDDLAKICSNIWGENFGNLPNLRYVIDEYSRVAKVGLDNKIKLVPNYKQIMSEALDRNNKRMFFDSFDEPNLNDKGQAPIEPTSETTELDSREYAYMAAIKTKPFLIWEVSQVQVRACLSRVWLLQLALVMVC